MPEERLSVPRPGATISGTIRRWSEALEEAHSKLSLLCWSQQTELAAPWFDPRRNLGLPAGAKTLSPELVSAALISVWLVARVHDPKLDLIHETEEWFCESSRDLLTDSLDRGALSQISFELSGLPSGEDLDDVLPYLMEVFEGNGVPRSRDRGIRWEAKRQSGVFYTPSDVADFVAAETLSGVDSSRLPLCLDPACGTGIFLRSALDVLLRQGHKPLDVASHLYGMDLSLSAVQSASFVLLSRCLRAAEAQKPLLAWETIRGNFAAIDSTTVSLHSSPVNDFFSQATQISSLFPGARSGFDVVIGNPPYSDLPRDDTQMIRKQLFATVPSKGAIPAYPLFVEMMWQLTNPNCSRSGMVVPLSVAYNSSSVFKVLRREIEHVQAAWRFYFFDRTPDSIFGDDVKTRVAILFMERSDNVAGSIATSPLIRWSSRSRNRLFDNLPSVQLSRPHIVPFIPKLGSRFEEETWLQLQDHGHRIGEIWDSVQNCWPTSDDRDLFHYSTSYNWLAVMRCVPGGLDNEGNRIIPTSLKRIRCLSEDYAWFTFGVLSSRLAYWLWRVSGDGFHLTRRFLESIPVHPSHFSENGFAEVCELASDLWSEMERRQTFATNSGVTTANFSPVGSEALLAKLDCRLTMEMSLPRDFAAHLEEFVRLTITAGR